MTHSLELTLCGIQILLSSSSSPLLDYLAEYFQYYYPVKIPSAVAEADALRVELLISSLEESGECRIPTKAKLLSESGIARLWRGETEDGERFFFDFGGEEFIVDPRSGLSRAWLTPQAMASPHILANTYIFFTILLLLRARGVYHLHAAAVLSPADELWLICGPQRAGKTTITTALGLAGWRPISDDSLLVDFDGLAPRLRAMKKAFHLSRRLLKDWRDLKEIPTSETHLDRVSVDGLRFFGALENAEQVYRKIDYLVMPRIIQEPRSHWRPSRPSDGLLRLAQQSAFFQVWPFHTQRQWKALLKLAGAAKSQTFFSGADLLADPHSISRFFNEMER